ncbi:mechanosensitive ion channel family protein [Thermosediminibacter oceani]|uniref:MscS Mechanosensitive ion channel n=1 Tax=Thermosediminibacter oceani (strain ATCC BAA-1034 / DSM 16646 / JW/IW-1228P) TaxID=555079 RepID=D9S189_THEOJ|nr:mechanosensitive ion channel family protein [Thermosediminibacter oceani]ADL08968.1 MscS Mechanosensitive ion channel [Thermosediminibacter oceani DSM 16646]
MLNYQLIRDMLYGLPPVYRSALKALVILFLASVTIRIGSRMIERIFALKLEKIPLNESRMKTLVGLLKSILRYIVYFIATVVVLETFGVKTTSIITAAGIGGLAIGFGAQSLVKDVISGFFIIFEDYFQVGEYIEAAGVSGTVEEMGLRTTKLRDFGGQLHIIPNGEITRVTNHSRGNLRAMVNVRVSYEEDLDRVLKVLEEVADEIRHKRKDIVEGPTVLGVSDLGPTEAVITIWARTLPMQQWSVERELRKAIKERFDREGIKIPYPRMVLINGASREEEEN